MTHTVVIGNGVAGTTFARHLRKLSDQKITIISNETDHFYSRTALMYIYMGHMNYEDTKPYEDWFWEKNRLELKRGLVVSIDATSKSITMEDGSVLNYDNLALALGSKPNMFGWPGQDLEAVQGLYHYQDLETMEKNTRGIKHAVIVGGGLIGIEMAEMLLARNISVTFLVREGKFWNKVLPDAEADMISQHIRDHHVDLRLGTELKEILGDEAGRAKGVVTSSGDTIDCGFVGLTAGVSPNISWVKDSTEIECNRGILVDDKLQTNIPGIFALGDCAELRKANPDRRPLEQVWYTGKMMGETLARTVSGQPSSYNPGVWFNSAKFFDIEYQTYGTVLAKVQDEIASFVWKHPKEAILLRLNFETKTRRLVGLNNFGLRLRHNVCELWLSQKMTIDEALADLGAANFDPEFFKQHEQDIIDTFNQSEYASTPVSLKTSKGLFSNFFNQMRG